MLVYILSLPRLKFLWALPSTHRSLKTRHEKIPMWCIFFSGGNIDLYACLKNYDHINVISMKLTSWDPDNSSSKFVRWDPAPTFWRIYGSSNSQSASRTILAYYYEGENTLCPQKITKVDEEKIYTLLYVASKISFFQITWLNLLCVSNT